MLSKIATAYIVSWNGKLHEGNELYQMSECDGTVDDIP